MIWYIFVYIFGFGGEDAGCIMNWVCYIASGVFWWHLEDHLFGDLSFMGTFYLHLLNFENCALNQNTINIVFICILLHTASLRTSLGVLEISPRKWQGSTIIMFSFSSLPIHCSHSYSQPLSLILSVGTLLFIIKTQTCIRMLHYLTFQQWVFKCHSGNNPTDFPFHAFTF